MDEATAKIVGGEAVQNRVWRQRQGADPAERVELKAQVSGQVAENIDQLQALPEANSPFNHRFNRHIWPLNLY